MRLDKIPKRLNTTSCAMWVKGLFSTEKKRDAKGLWVVYNAFYVIVNTVNAALKKGGGIEIQAKRTMSNVSSEGSRRWTIICGCWLGKTEAFGNTSASSGYCQMQDSQQEVWNIWNAKRQTYPSFDCLTA